MAAAEALTRRAAILAVAGAAAMPSLQSALATSAPWSTAKPEDAGFSSDLSDKLDAGVRSGLLGGLHAVLVSRNERLVLERYYPGADKILG